MNLRAAFRGGLIMAVVSFFLILIGLTNLVGTLLSNWVKLGSKVPGAWATLLLVGLFAGVRTVRRAEPTSWGRALAFGLAAAISYALPVAIFVGIIAQLIVGGADLRQWLVQLNPPAVSLLTLGRAPAPAAIVMFIVLFLAVMAGAILVRLRLRFAWAAQARRSLADLFQQVRAAPAVSAATKSRAFRPSLIALGIIVLLVTPMLLNQYGNYTLGTVGIYVLLGLGLNIVVGMAGLLDLGYVAFFAVGAYTCAILTAPQPNQIMLDFWVVLSMR